MSVIVAIKDTDGYLHAPMDDEGGHAVCGLDGERIDFPASYTGRWCSTCMYDCVSSDGVRLWPVITEASEPQTVRDLAQAIITGEAFTDTDAILVARAFLDGCGETA